MIYLRWDGREIGLESSGSRFLTISKTVLVFHVFGLPQASHNSERNALWTYATALRYSPVIRFVPGDSGTVELLSL